MKIIVILTLTLACSGAAKASGLLGQASRAKPPGTAASPTDSRRLTNVDQSPNLENPLLQSFMAGRSKLDTEVYDHDNPPPSDQTVEDHGLNPASFWKREPRKSINIIHFNDVYEIRYESFWITELRKYMEVLRNPAIIFSGDIIAPSLVSQKLIRAPGFQFRKLFRDFKIDVSVPGNHEGDKGEGNFIDFTDLNYVDPADESTKQWSPNEKADGVDKPTEKTDKKPGLWLLANLRPKNPDPTIFTKKDSPNWGNLRGATILQMNGFKFGFFGLVDENWINGSAVKSVRKGYDYIEFDQVAREYSHLLKKAGCHFVGAVTHMTNVNDRILLEDNENAIDFVFGGHEHIFLVERKNNRVLLKSGSDFKQFSAIRFELFRNKAELEASVHESNLKIEDGRPADIIEDNKFSFVLDELNEEQMKTRHWHFPAKWDFPGKGKDGEALADDPANADLKQYTYLNVYIERVDISFSDPSKMDPEFQEDFKQNYLPMLKEEMVPVFHFRDAVDAREPQIYGGEMPIGDFLTDIIKADTFADIVMLNAGSVKSEFAFPKDTVIMKADAMRMLQRPSESLRSVPTVKSVTMLFNKWMEKYNQFSPDLPYFSGINVDVITKGGAFVKCVLKDEAGVPLPEDKRVQFVSLQFTAEATASDAMFTQEIPNELAKLKKEYLEAVIAADRQRELMDYYENSLIPEGEEKKYDLMELQGDNIWEWTYAVSKKYHHTTSILSALDKAYTGARLFAEINDPSSLRVLEKEDIAFKKKELGNISQKIFFPESKDIFNVGRRPYTSLQKFFTVANSAFTKDYLDGFAAKALEGLTAYQVMNPWNQPPAPLDQVPRMTDDKAWPDNNVLSDTPLKYDVKDDSGKIKLKNLAYLRTVRDEDLRRKLNFLSLHLNYKFERKTAEYLIAASQNQPESKGSVEVISLNPTNMKRMKIIEMGDGDSGSQNNQRAKRQDLV